MGLSPAAAPRPECKAQTRLEQRAIGLAALEPPCKEAEINWFETSAVYRKAVDPSMLVSPLSLR